MTTVRNVVEFTCPFCGRPASAMKGVEDPDVAGVMHAEPACGQFIALEPDEYLHQVNRVLRLHLNN